MPDPNYQALRRRKARLTQSVVASLVAATKVEDVKTRLDELEAVNAMLATMRRDTAFVWAARAALTLLVLVLIVSRVSLSSVSVTMAAKARAATIDLGATSENVLAGVAALKRAHASSSHGEQCFTSDAHRSECVPVEALLANTVTAFGHAALTIQAQDGCTTVTMEKGGADVVLTFRRAVSSAPPAAEQAASSRPRNWETAHVELTSGDSLTLCPQQHAELRVPQPSRVLIGNRIDLGPAEVVVTPAMVEGTLSVGETGRSSTLGRTDVVSFGDIRNATIVLDVTDVLSLAFVGTVASGAVSSGSGTQETSVVPTWLEFLWHSPLVKSLIGLIGAVIAFVLSTRDRILAELGK